MPLARLRLEASNLKGILGGAEEAVVVDGVGVVGRVWEDRAKAEGLATGDGM